jgi:transposase-like protein
LSVSGKGLKSQVGARFRGSYPVNGWIGGAWGWQNERRVRCPKCGSLDTKRHGRTSAVPIGLAGPLGSLQRFLCRGCGRTFTSSRRAARPRARFADDAIEEAVRLYVQGLPSYRVLSALLEQRLGRPVGRFTLNGWVDELGGRAKTPVEVSAELRPPSWGGFLGVDGKAIYVRGEERCLLSGVDQATHDVVHALVLQAESEDGFERLVREAVTEAGYPLKGLVMDAAPPFLAAHANSFARLALQLCRIHASRRLDFDIPKAKNSPDAPLRAELKDRVRTVLFAPDEATARGLLGALLQDRARYEGLGRRDTLGALEKRFDLYMTHHQVEGMPADANITENVIKQLGKKLRLMEGFATLESAERFTRLLVGCYRFKRFTDSCRRKDNGKSPLQLAGVDTEGTDWLRFLLQR